MTLDVVVVSFHSTGVLPASLAAASRFAGSAARFFVVDNSPGEGTAELVAQLVPDATVIENEENRGFGPAVNQGVAQGQGDLVLLLNPDVSELRGSLADVERLFASDPRLAAVGVRLVYPDDSQQENGFRRPRLFDAVALETRAAAGRLRPGRQAVASTSSSEARAVRDVDWVTGACLFLRRAALMDVGPFDERFFLFFEEADWLLRAKERGWRVVFFPGVEAVHASGRSASETPLDRSLLYAQSLHRFNEKHFGRRSIVVRVLLFLIEGLKWLTSLASPRHAGRRREHRERMRVHLTGSLPPRVRTSAASRRS